MTGATTRLAVVTGAAGGIGGAVCRRLAADGFAVACLDVREQAAARLAKELPLARGYGGSYLHGAVLMVDGGVTA